MLTLTYTNKRTHKSRKINLNRLFTGLLILTLIITFTASITDFMRFPDKYITTWKYQLKNEIASGDQKAIDYYNKYYTSKGVKNVHSGCANANVVTDVWYKLVI